MFFSSSLVATAAFASTAWAQAQYLAPELSFGHSGKISPNGRAIPNFHIIGDPQPPEILSNKIILTPISPGNQRAGVWTEKPVAFSQWTADVEFRASGPERGGGNLQIWLAKDGQIEVGTSSIYTVDAFEGFGLIIDQYGGNGGSIRGFLNDGNTHYKTHSSVDSLAFGHCNFPYRNLGRPLQVKIRHDESIFRVEVDGKQCFETPRIQIPQGYYFGVTAASAENPDSFEVYKMVITTDLHHNDFIKNQDQPQAPPAVPPQELSEEYKEAQTSTDGTLQGEDVPIVPASSIEVGQQFADLHNRLQSLSKHLNGMQRDLKHFKSDAMERNRELKDLIQSGAGQSGSGALPNAQLDRIEKRLDSIEQSILVVKNDVARSDFKRQLDEIRRAVKDSHTNLLEGLPSTLAASSPSLLVFIVVVVGAQVGLVGAYLYYKKRRNSMPKKYL